MNKTLTINMARYFIVLYLDSFTPHQKGDTLGGGEYYFEANNKRYPDKGIIKLKKNEVFDPEPNPTFYTAIVDGGGPLKVKIRAKEQDLGLDDTFIKETIEIPVEETDDTITLVGEKKQCTMKLVLKIKQVKDW